MKKLSAVLIACRRRVLSHRFYRDEQGGMAFFVLFMFFLMLAFGGIAVDVMRFETKRIAVQQTMDRASLAAASLKQSLDPKAVFDDFFAKSNVNNDLVMFDVTVPTVTVTTTGNFKKVVGAAEVRSYNFFMHLMNVDYLEGSTVSTAEQGVANIEIFLVLDVSSSMQDNGKIGALKTAAKNFVNTIKLNDTLDKASIGIVPYNAQVNLGKALREQYNATHVHVGLSGLPSPVPDVNCLELPTSLFESTAISTTMPLPMSAHADTHSGTSGAGSGYKAWNSSDATFVLRSNNPCWVTTYGTVMLPTKTKAPLISKIDSLKADGNTSIFMGMRWAVALSDETAKPIYSAIADGTVKADRPAANSDALTRKIIILMTDGDHFESHWVPDAYKTGLSNVWRSSGDGNYSSRFTSGRPLCAGTNEYWVPHLWKPTASGNTIEALKQPCGGAWQSVPWAGGTGGFAVQQDWSQLWRVARMSWFARQLFGRAGVTGVTYDNRMSAWKKQNFQQSEMDTLLSKNCSAARLAGMEVYGIAFTAPPDGTKAISDCSSSPKENYFFDASNAADLNAAFQQIAAQISELRLTQ
jgi:Flp pilus assembly protein TadG